MSKILIIEDDPYVLRFYGRLFSLGKYEVETASGGKEGLEKAKASKPNLILLDIMMPELDGFAVLRKLKADPATKDIEVIMLTNLSDTDSYKKALELGANGYLVKIDNPPEKLIDEVEKHIHV